jgi:hypothetical protein
MISPIDTGGVASVEKPPEKISSGAFKWIIIGIIASLFLIAFLIEVVAIIIVLWSRLPCL